MGNMYYLHLHCRITIYHYTTVSVFTLKFTFYKQWVKFTFYKQWVIASNVCFAPTLLILPSH